MDDRLFTDVTLQISSSYTIKRIIYNYYISNWSKPHIYEKGIDGELSLCGKHRYVIEGGCEVSLDVVQENPKLICKICYGKYKKKLGESDSSNDSKEEENGNIKCAD